MQKSAAARSVPSMEVEEESELSHFLRHLRNLFPTNCEPPIGNYFLSSDELRAFPPSRSWFPQRSYETLSSSGRPRRSGIIIPRRRSATAPYYRRRAQRERLSGRNIIFVNEAPRPRWRGRSTTARMGGKHLQRVIQRSSAQSLSEWQRQRRVA